MSVDGQGTPGVDERLAPVNGIEIAYEDLGDPDGAPILLVMGLGMQLLGWEPEFCELLTGRGYRTIRFDNRDTGHSTKIDAPMPGMLEIFVGRRHTAAYTLDEMADDAAGLLDHLQIESAHVVGASMGGMIAQVLAIRHPARVRSLGMGRDLAPGTWQWIVSEIDRNAARADEQEDRPTLAGAKSA